MDRRCFHCASKFTIFKKECGCKSCGRAFCAGCLGFTALLPAYGNTKQKICKKCHESITSGKDDQRNSCSKWSPPENYKKRVAAFEAKQSQQKVIQMGPGLPHGGTNLNFQGLSAEDRAIAERLEKLKQETKPKTIASTAEIESRVRALQKGTQGPVPSLQEIEDRLAILQGRTPPSRTTKPLHQPTDTQPQGKKNMNVVQMLFAQHFTVLPPTNNLNKVDQIDSRTVANTELDAEQLEREKDRILREAAVELQDENTRQEKMLEIAKRLAALQGKDPNKVTVDNIKLPDSDEETEEEGVQRILKQLAEESALDEASGYNIPPQQSRTEDTKGRVQAEKKLPSSQMNKPPAQNPPARPVAVKAQVADSDEEELPWCCICNKDAVLRCHGCDDDLYCKRCFREGHDTFDQEEHQTSTYRPPQKKKGR
ncbi:PREDICTED: abscission/NoCut checkpoint regulator [Nanorana parkeri]|uniref:abscission/NoCut checkpoint regulator n=1 Tax=Nanorana parkeri TaxID=125878 RepID=UPI0008546F0E|nr:PREDICTED: abscission/NoCut checkpoint regulator [Nanorana parkeri]